MIAPALETIAGHLDALADELDLGHPINPDELHTAARRLRAQVEMLREGIASPD